MSLVTLCPHCHIQVDVLMIEACKQPVCLKSCEVVELDPSVFAALFPEAVITQQASLAFEKTSPSGLSSQSDDSDPDFWATIPGSLRHL
jgi:hypothetical protein